jgi:hypothetical protein
MANLSNIVLPSGLQPTLISGTNLKTVNGLSLLGSGDVPLLSTTVIREVKTATAAQTVFTLDNSYTVGVNALMVYRNGARLLNSEYTETNATTVTLITGATLNDELLFEIGVVTAGATTTAGLTSFNPAGNIAATNVQAAIAELDSEKQATLVSGTNIKTVNGQSILGSGDVAVLGTGGTTATVPLTLTASSPAMQSIAATAYGQAVTLPDATTLNRGVTVFGLYNAGTFPIPINNASGTLLGFVQPLRHVICSLAANGTAAGDWDLLGHTLVGVLEEGFLTAGADMTGIHALRIVEIDADRILLLLGGNTLLTGTVYNRATRTFGSMTTIRAVGVEEDFLATKSNTDQVLVCSVIASNGGSPQAVVLSISGLSITVNTPAALQATGNALLFGAADGSDGAAIVQVGSSFLITYRESTYPVLQAITISGTTPTVGTAIYLTGTVLPAIFAASSSVAMVFFAGSSVVTCRPYTVSGTTLTAGTETFITSSSNAIPLIRQIGSRWAVVVTNSPATRAAIVSLSGTTATHTAVAEILAASHANRRYIHAVGNQVIVVGAGTSTGVVNVLTDNAGTAVAGSPVTFTVSSGSTNGWRVVGFDSSSLWVSYNGLSRRVFMRVTISGNNPECTTLTSFGEGLADSVADNMPFLNQVTLAGVIGTVDAAIFNFVPLIGSQITICPGRSFFPVGISNGYPVRTETILEQTVSTGGVYGRESDSTVWGVGLTGGSPANRVFAFRRYRAA